MKTFTLFSERLTDFSKIEKENLQDSFVLHGIIHWFDDEFDLGLQVFRDYLAKKEPELAIKLTPRELVLEAYERYLFVDEDTWLAMLKDRYHPDIKEPVQARAARVIHRYIPAFCHMKDQIENCNAQ